MLDCGISHLLTMSVSGSVFGWTAVCCAIIHTGCLIILGRFQCVQCPFCNWRTVLRYRPKQEAILDNWSLAGSDQDISWYVDNVNCTYLSYDSDVFIYIYKYLRQYNVTHRTLIACTRLLDTYGHFEIETRSQAVFIPLFKKKTTPTSLCASPILCIPTTPWWPNFEACAFSPCCENKKQWHFIMAK